MAESQKGTSSSVISKDKKLSLDEEIGTEFLSSWKSLSVAGDDTMDFSFDTVVSSGKKKTFNFDKLDLDFNLDGDFDKLTSFKMHMPDLDISLPSKKCTKPKESSKGESSSGNHQGKRDCFGFSFDFNELDNFNFDSSIIQGGNTSVKHLHNKRTGSDTSEHQSSKVNPAAGDDAFDENQPNKLPASENATTGTVETNVNCGGTGTSSNANFPSRSGNLGDLAVSHSARTSSEKTISAPAEEADEQSHFLVKAMATEPIAQQINQSLPVQSVDGNNSTQDAESDIQSGSLAIKVNIESSEEENVIDRMIGSNHENLQLNNSFPPYISKSEHSTGDGEKANSETPTIITGTKPMLDDLDIEATSTATLLRSRLHEIKENIDIQKSPSKLLVPLRSESLVNKVIPIKEKESEIVSSKFFQKSKETEPRLCQALSAGIEASLSGSKRIAASSPENGIRQGFKADDEKTHRKIIGDAKSLSAELTKGEPALPSSEKNVENPSDILEGFNGDGVKDACKLLTNPRPPDKEVTKGNSSVVGSGMNNKVVNNFGSGINSASSSDKATKSNTQTSVNSITVISSMESTRSSKMIAVERLKAGKRTPDLSSLKISRPTGVSKDHSDTVLERGLSSLKNSEKIMVVQGITASKIIHPIVNAERKTLLSTSLKRKSPEASYADLPHLHPPKRLSQSPNENRNLKKPLEGTFEEQGRNYDNLAESETEIVLCNQSPAGFEIPQQANTKQQAISLAVENDGNVEKAEAYAKELDDICNMLKKKHEEAKEILVRAIVNNNSLLMLNHPMFDEKIRMVQKFAAQLVSN